jgi:hypothetical protein
MDDWSAHWLGREGFFDFGKASTYLPVIELVRSYFEISSGDEQRKWREKSRGKIGALDCSFEVDQYAVKFGSN